MVPGCARKLYENQHLDNLQALFTGEILAKAIMTEEALLKADNSDPLTMLKWVSDALGFVQDGQIPVLDSFLGENSVDVIVHDSVGFAAGVVCTKYNVPCVAASVLMNDDAGTMLFWRPPVGMGLHPSTPGFLERVGLFLGNILSRTVVAYIAWSNTRRGDLLLHGRDTGAGMDLAVKLFKGCPLADMFLVKVTPGLDQAQVIAPSTVFVGPMRDFDRYAPLEAGSPELQFLDGALSSNVPVVFMAAGVTAWITDSYIEEHLAIIRELTRDGAVRVLWANRRGIGERSIPDTGVMIASWLPQEAVLHHPAVKVFVTHGGSTSMMEGVAAGVPFICSPYAFEQINNCLLLQYRKMGLYVPEKSPVEDFVSSIRKLLANNAAFADQVSSVWKRVVAFGEGDNAYGARRAVRMVESVAQSGHGFLRPEICDWPTYQVYHLDVFFFMLLLSAAACWPLFLFSGRCLRSKAVASCPTGKKKTD